MSSGRVVIVRLMAGLIKKISLYKMSFYPEPDSYSRNKTKGDLDLFNYGTKSNVENVADVDTSDFAKKAVPNDLSKFDNVVKYDV